MNAFDYDPPIYLNLPGPLFYIQVTRAPYFVFIHKRYIFRTDHKKCYGENITNPAANSCYVNLYR
jgi:hypothetical protein